MPKSEGLTPKQEMFCREYVVDFNATQAAIRAGYSPGGAASYASKLLVSTSISARVRELAKRVAKKVELKAEHALRRAKETLDANLYDLIDIDAKGRVTLTEKGKVALRKQRGALEVKYSASEGETGSSESCQVRIKDNTQAMKIVFQYLRLIGDDRNPEDENPGIDEARHERIMGAIERIKKRRERKGV